MIIPLSCFTVSTTHCFIIHSPIFFSSNKMFLFKPKVCNFDSSVKRTCFQSSLVGCFCCFIHCSHFFLILGPKKWLFSSGYSTTKSCFRQSPLHCCHRYLIFSIFKIVYPRLYHHDLPII